MGGREIGRLGASDKARSSAPRFSGPDQTTERWALKTGSSRPRPTSGLDSLRAREFPNHVLCRMGARGAYFLQCHRNPDGELGDRQYRCPYGPSAIPRSPPQGGPHRRDTLIMPVPEAELMDDVKSGRALLAAASIFCGEITNFPQLIVRPSASVIFRRPWGRISHFTISRQRILLFPRKDRKEIPSEFHLHMSNEKVRNRRPKITRITPRRLAPKVFASCRPYLTIQYKIKPAAPSRTTAETAVEVPLSVLPFSADI